MTSTPALPPVFFMKNRVAPTAWRCPWCDVHVGNITSVADAAEGTIPCRGHFHYCTVCATLAVVTDDGLQMARRCHWGRLSPASRKLYAMIVPGPIWILNANGERVAADEQ